VLLTTNLLAPEAYVLAGLIDWWANEKPAASVEEAAGAAYHRFQRCGLRGATRLFTSGWAE